VEEAISEMHTADLLIACASAAGESQAIIALESTFFSRLEKLFRRPRFPAALADDVLQTLREQLFVGSEQTPPRIEGYRGQGPLSRWLQVVAVRTAARLIGKAEKEIPVAEHRPETLTSQQEPLVEALKRKYRQQFKRAFEKALADLTPRQRTLLRQHHIDGLTLDELAMAYRVHRATIARWLARAREQLAVETQQTVSAQLAEEGTDLLSISRLVDSQLLPTLNSVLQAGLD
jgi:RNA polymerase sigma-70 factor (ECF subfamily)